MLTNNAQKNAKKFECASCDFKCSKKSNYGKHIQTRKHQCNMSLTEKMPSCDHICANCKKKYKSRVGLWYHSKKCLAEEGEGKGNEEENEEENEEKTVEPVLQTLADLVIEVVKNNKELQQQNQEFQKQMLELYKMRILL